MFSCGFQHYLQGVSTSFSENLKSMPNQDFDIIGGKIRQIEV